MAQNAGEPLTGIVVTQPQYLPLLKLARDHVPTFYYCSDDYTQYSGWGGESILETESELVRLATHSFFVSSALAQRAIEMYGANPDTVSVSPNATDDSFLTPAPAEQIQALLSQHPQLKRPIVGVVGAINERLDFELLLAAAGLPEVGTLLLIGPVAEDIAYPAWLSLKTHPRCVVVGPKPHAELPRWMQLLDLALIPYRDNPLNVSCSPMRLFDHLASGNPIIASNACQQLGAFRDQVVIFQNSAELLNRVARFCSAVETFGSAEDRIEVARHNLWSTRAQKIQSVLALYNA